LPPTAVVFTLTTCSRAKRRRAAGRGQILETYYSFPVGDWRVTADYQFIVNPAYNRDRGPVFVIGARLRTQF
jgi:high affinity Mn2+ porin